jgi:chromosome segregation ATPase
VDVVIAPGARGKRTEAMKQTYSRNRENEPGAEASAQEPHERKLRMEKEIQEALEKVNSTLASVAETLTALASEKQAKESEKAQAEADEAAVKERVANVTANLDAIEAARADLLPSQVESLRAEAKAGTDVTARIEEAKTIAKEAREAFEGKQEESASTGRTFGDRKVESAVDLGKVFG